MKVCDAAQIGGVSTTQQGYLKAFSRSARTGIQSYKGADFDKPDMPVVRILRDETAVFDKATVEQFANLPVTVGHPQKGVSAKDWKKKAVGHTTGDIMRDGDFLRVGLVVMDGETKTQVEAGRNQLSWGYKAEIEWGEGVTQDGEVYDGRMTNIRPNHLAIVDVARGGDKLNIGDGEVFGLQGDQWGVSPIQVADAKDEPMNKRTLTFDGITVEVTDQAAQVIEKLQGQTSALQATIEAKDGEIADLTKQKSTLDGEIAVLKKTVEDSKVTPAKMNDMAMKRAKIMKKAKKVMGKEPDEDMEDGAIMRAAVAHHLGDGYSKDMSDEAVSGAFSVIGFEDSEDDDPLAATLADGIKGPRKDVNANDGDVFAMAGVKMKKGEA